jgi:hypothetical protein
MKLLWKGVGVAACNDAAVCMRACLLSGPGGCGTAGLLCHALQDRVLVDALVKWGVLVALHSLCCFLLAALALAASKGTFILVS